MVMKKNLLNLLFCLISASAFAQSGIRKENFPTGVHQFHYISMLFSGDEVGKSGWDKPNVMRNDARFEFINNDEIHRLGKAPSDTQFLTRVGPDRFTGNTPPSSQLLDFRLVGIFNYSHMPNNMFYLFYYSAKRDALMEQIHDYEVGRIMSISLYLNRDNNPFKNHQKYFKMLPSNNTYYYNVTPKAIDSMKKSKKINPGISSPKS